MRLAIVVSHPTQYYSPWFAWIAQHAAIELRVFYLWDFGVRAQRDAQFGTSFKWDRDLLSGYASEFVPNRASNPGTHRFRGLDNPELESRLAKWGPDAVLLFGYKYRTHIRLIARRRWPLIFRGDSHLLGQTRVGFLKRSILRQLYRRFAAITFTGQANRAYFRAFGVAENRLYFAPHCVDDAHFTASDANRAAAAQLRQELDIGNRRVLLFAGKLVPAKAPDALLDAFVQAAPKDFALVFVGDGELRHTLQQKAATHPDRHIRFLPFANQSEMPARYLLADIFCLPSRGLYETWGLAVNEAMHLGVPALVSDRVGCQRDLVTDGKTGWVFPADNPAALRETVARACHDVLTSRDALRTAVANRIGGYTYVQATDGLLRAVGAVTRPCG